MGAILCGLAAITTYFAVGRSARFGLIIVFLWGFLYGILRANYLDSFAHFIFDASLIAFYCAYGWKLTPDERKRLRTLRTWLVVLIGWALLIAIIPFQHPLVTLVGLRGNIFFLPLILVGARLKTKDLLIFAGGVAVLNLLAIGFGSAEYVLGVKRFFPFNAVTQIIYNSNDVAGYQYLRIPSTFVTAHAYGGAMVATLPFLFGAWAHPGAGRIQKLLFVSGMVAALVGVLMSSTRVNFLYAALVALAAILTANIRAGNRVLLIIGLVIVGIVASGNQRLSRFKSLGNGEVVTDRLSGSVNRTFWQIAQEYPMGNGLGGGGTSIPFFLANLVKRPVGMESEYARIMLEQGIPGLLLWGVFFGWLLTSSRAFERGPFRSGRILAWVSFCFSCVAAAVGTGLMTSIPQTPFLLLCMGWIAVRQRQVPDDLEELRRESSEETRAVSSEALLAF
ncbi:MAG: hypothetical protein WA324_15160 [Bryobacteraceae bacterium]